MRLLLGRPGEGERDLTNMGQQRVARVVHAGMRHAPSMPEIVVHNRAGSEKRAAGPFHMVSGMCMFRFRDPDFERASTARGFGLEWGPDGPKRDLDWTSLEAIGGESRDPGRRGRSGTCRTNAWGGCHRSVKRTHRVFPVGLLGVAGWGGGDSLPGWLTVDALEPVRRHRHGRAVVQIDGRPIWVRHQIDVPVRMRAPTVRCDDQPRVLTVGEPRHRRLPWLSALSPRSAGSVRPRP